MSKLLLYCVKAKPYLEYKQIPRTLMEFDNSFEGYRCSYKRTEDDENFQLNGKIVAECDFEVEDLRIVDDDPLGSYWYETKTLSENEVLEKSCLTSDELYEYLGDYNEGYAIHIKNLHIFDEPREITDLVLLNQYRKDLKGQQYNRVKVAPQNMCLVDYCVEVFGKYDCTNHLLDSPYILISIRPEWLCKILNGEKTIEVRKKVLKEMLE